MAAIDIEAGSGYGLDNLPYGVFSVRPGTPAAARTEPGRRHLAVAVGEVVIDLGGIASGAGMSSAGLFGSGSLGPFLASGPENWAAVRRELSDLLGDDHRAAEVATHSYPRAEVDLHLPFAVADYLDFYSSEQHAANAGRIFRPEGDLLPPNWKHLPIGYHGRAGTIVVSGTPIRRPWGQRKGPQDAAPVFAPSERLDVEAEVGFVVGVGSHLGERVPVSDFAEHVFGLVLVNDWSARDIQAFESAPLGPFLGKSFATSISPFVIPLAALETARVLPPPRDPTPAKYLADDQAEPWGLDLSLEVSLNGTVVSRPPFRTMYWTAPQQLAHMTVNGASLRTGDLFASGTVSGRGRDEWGSFLELSWNGRDLVELTGGKRRTFLEDGDEVVIRATAPGANGGSISLGEVSGKVSPALPVD